MGYDKNYGNQSSTNVVGMTISKVYGWMTLALLVSAVAAVYTASQPGMVEFIFSNSITRWGMIIAEFGLVIYLSARVLKMSFSTAAMCFGLYSIINGVFLSSIFYIFEMPAIVTAFLATSATFGVMSFVGYTTQKDLANIGGYLLMALIGVIIGTVVNLFLQNAMVHYLITYIGLAVFVGLTAYDTQKIKKMLAYGELTGMDTRNLGIIGALNLYLDFVNIFLYLLRIFGRRD